MNCLRKPEIGAMNGEDARDLAPIVARHARASVHKVVHQADPFTIRRSPSTQCRAGLNGALTMALNFHVGLRVCSPLNYRSSEVLVYANSFLFGLHSLKDASQRLLDEIVSKIIILSLI